MRTQSSAYMQCPHCRSHNTQSVPTAYSQSVRIGDGGYTTVSAFGRDLEPPRRESEFVYPVSLAIVTVLFVDAFLPYFLGAPEYEWFFGLSILDWRSLTVSGVVGAMNGLRAAAASIHHNRTVVEDKMEAWYTSAVCKRCGEHFQA